MFDVLRHTGAARWLSSGQLGDKTAASSVLHAASQHRPGSGHAAQQEREDTDVQDDSDAERNEEGRTRGEHDVTWRLVEHTLVK